MRISPSAPSAPVVQPTSTVAAASVPSFRSPTKGEVALLDLHGVGFFSLQDSLTGYGRHEGYDSLANARRAAYMLSVGTESPAAGVFSQGNRFFVRSLGAVAGQNPHARNAIDDPGSHVGELIGAQLLHFENNTMAHFAWVRDSRLVLLVDGATKIWTKDAHHQPPKG
ncbi:MAG: hypothetical protein JWL76_2259 [Thermoleophilia bacterium]|nr:hypothetical protein [Thermoleophilia bacterium]